MNTIGAAQFFPSVGRLMLLGGGSNALAYTGVIMLWILGPQARDGQGYRGCFFINVKEYIMGIAMKKVAVWGGTCLVNDDGRGDVPYHPLSLFVLITERMPYAMVLSRSLMVNLLDQSERIVPVLTPAALEYRSPLMKPPNG